MRYVQDMLDEFSAQEQQERHGAARRCVIVAHWDAMQGVAWNSVLTLTSP